jgi:hypothetical protein
MVKLLPWRSGDQCEFVDGRQAGVLRRNFCQTDHPSRAINFWPEPLVSRLSGTIEALLQVVANASVIRGNISPATTCGIQWESSSQNWALEWCR